MHCHNGCIPTGTDEGDKLFASKWNQVRHFQAFTPIGKQRWRRCPACVPTRWWCVGEACECGWCHCLLPLKFSQCLINCKGTNSVINVAASNLQSHLIEVHFHSDMCLVKCFHDGHFCRHMAWMMESNDLTKECGFQSHQAAVRHFVMHKDLVCH